MSSILAVSCVVALAAVAWSWAGQRWAFPRLPEVASASGIPPAHVVGFSRAYRALWHASGSMWAMATIGAATLILLDRTERLQWMLFAVLLLQALASNLAMLQAVPQIRRHLPRTRATAVLSWMALTCVLWGAWHFAQK